MPSVRLSVGCVEQQRNTWLFHRFSSSALGWEGRSEHMDWPSHAREPQQQQQQQQRKQIPPDVKIQIDRAASRASSATNQNQGTSTDSTDTAVTEVTWSREVKEPKKLYAKAAKRGLWLHPPYTLFDRVDIRLVL